MGRYGIFIITYILGAIPFAYLAGRFKNIDVRRHGSGNIGTTNAFRLLGVKWGIAVLIGDALKGALATWLGIMAVGPWGGILGGLLAMAGHSWNPFFGFKPSGKGVASGLGIILVLMPKITIIALILFLIVVIFTRYVSMGSVVAALALLIFVFVFQEPLAYRVFAIIASSVVIIRHRTNFQRVLNGTENRFGVKKK
ncbi:glycerol-3-phosphate 1-O-acyltransferase PlsY [Desulfitobacterium sp. Sab5]|uniref:glycerol-3-phosphate 1-O-acyltransferase PlsY n=1 Tax=Desulfitobacterium TaxID=36853 RepID=UPI003CED9FAB